MSSRTTKFYVDNYNRFYSEQQRISKIIKEKDSELFNTYCVALEQFKSSIIYDNKKHKRNELNKICDFIYIRLQIALEELYLTF